VHLALILRGLVTSAQQSTLTGAMRTCRDGGDCRRGLQHVRPRDSTEYDVRPVPYGLEDTHIRYAINNQFDCDNLGSHDTCPGLSDCAERETRVRLGGRNLFRGPEATGPQPIWERLGQVEALTSLEWPPIYILNFFPWILSLIVSCFRDKKTRAHVRGKGSRRSKLGETKIDWLFGTVDRYILYIE
jgi:hypothetical protein